MKALSKEHSVQYGQRTIAFSIFYCDRKTMEIAVHPDSNVVIKAPTQSDISLIEKKVIKRARWILKSLNYFKQFTPKTPERCYVSGETHLYLGKQYRLKICRGDKNSVKLSRGFFHITCRNEATPEAAKKLLDQWYLEKAQIQFAEIMDTCWLKFHRLGTSKPKLSIRRMKKRWGSLSRKGTITLNIDLIKTPKECINYVVIHELCHLRHHDHGSDFHKLLGTIIPEWEKVKHKLEVSMV